VFILENIKGFSIGVNKWLDSLVCCQQIPEKTLKKQQNQPIMSKIKIVPPF
jgi:hypothetical protein